MTAQMAETLYENGEEYDLLTAPLEAIWSSRRKRRLRPRFDNWSTGCFRGYAGTWLIEDGRLWLTALSAYLGGEEVGLADILPGKPIPLLADWYSGELRVPMGPLIKRAPFWPDRLYETEVFITVERGQVIGRQTIQPEPPEPRKFHVDQWLAAGRKRREAERAEAETRRELRRQQFTPKGQTCQGQGD